MLLEKFYQKRILLEKSDLKPTNSTAGTPYDSKDILSCHSGGSYWPPQAPYALSRFTTRPVHYSRVFFPPSEARHYGCFWDFLSKKVSKIRTRILCTNKKQIRKNKLLLLCQLLNWQRIEPLFFFWFFTRSYLKLRFFSNTFWTKLPKSSHSARTARTNRARLAGSRLATNAGGPDRAAPRRAHYTSSFEQFLPGFVLVNYWNETNILWQKQLTDNYNCNLQSEVFSQKNSIRIQWSVLSFEKGLEVKNLELVHLFSIVCFVYTALVVPTFKVKIKVLVSLIYNNQF